MESLNKILVECTNKWTLFSSYVSLKYEKYKKMIELEKTYLKSSLCVQSHVKLGFVAPTEDFQPTTGRPQINEKMKAEILIRPRL